MKDGKVNIVVGKIRDMVRKWEQTKRVDVLAILEKSPPRPEIL